MNCLQLPDGEGRAQRMLLWNHPGDDVTGQVARSEKVIGTCEEVLFLVPMFDIFTCYSLTSE